MSKSHGCREDAELQERVTAEKRGLPNTVDGFKRHPLFILERHITKYQALEPGTKKAGLHRCVRAATGSLVPVLSIDLMSTKTLLCPPCK